MAKSSTFFGLRRGSTKSLTFQVNNGQQITKDRVTEVKNPQTEAQMIQRFVMNTVIRAYSQFQELCDHSFENVQVGMDSMKNFISLNCGALRARVAAAIDNGEDLYGLWAFTPKGEKYLVPNAYVISRGSLPEVTTTIPALLGCVPLGSGAANTYQGVIDALGLQRGDQLTFVTIEGNGPTRIAMRYARVILDPQNADGSEASLTSPFVGADNKINLPNVRNEGSFLGLTFADNSINFKFTNQGVGAAGVIVSRKVNDAWKRSNCQLVIKASTIAGFFPSLGECLDMVGQSDIATRNALYLNNAGRGRVAVAHANVIPAYWRQVPETNHWLAVDMDGRVIVGYADLDDYMPGEAPQTVFENASAVYFRDGSTVKCDEPMSSAVYADRAIVDEWGVVGLKGNVGYASAYFKFEAGTRYDFTGTHVAESATVSPEMNNYTA